MSTIFQYAAKFVCGKSDGKILAPGEYWTAINIHNPLEKSMEITMKCAVALPGKPGQVSKWVSAKLGPDQALEVDRAQITKLAGERADFMKGFVVIRSPTDLDVVAVYTAAGSDERVETMSIERVVGRKLFEMPDIGNVVDFPYTGSIVVNVQPR